jgi:hypothetical protein
MVAKTTGKPQATVSKARAAMAVILRDVPAGHNWGWFSREDARMHFQTLDRKHFGLYKIWLEHAGRRVMEPATAVPAKVLKRVTAEIERLRQHIEGRWTTFMIESGWIQLHVDLPEVIMTAYPHTPNKFTRRVNLQRWFAPETYAEIEPSDVFLNRELPALSVFKDRPGDLRHDFYLPDILWHG